MEAQGALSGFQIENIAVINVLTGETIKQKETAAIYPAKHYVTTQTRLQEAIKTIKVELDERLAWFRSHNKLLEAQRLEMRSNYDLEMMQEMGYCSGIENYSRHLTGREKGNDLIH